MTKHRRPEDGRPEDRRRADRRPAGEGATPDHPYRFDTESAQEGRMSGVEAGDAQWNDAVVSSVEADDELGRLLFSVPVPAERMERLRAAWPASLNDISAAERLPNAHRRRSIRESLLMAAGLVALAACLAIGIWLVQPSPWEQLDREQLAQLASSEWSRAERAAWRPFQFQESGRKYYRASPFLSEAPARWRSFETSLDSDAVMFELDLRGQEGRLFALKADRRLRWLPEKPPVQPQQSGDGGKVAAWQEGDMVYVLSVEGPAYVYWNAVRSRPTSFARFGE